MNQGEPDKLYKAYALPISCRYMALYEKRIKYSGHLPLQTTALSLWHFLLQLISNKALYERKHSEPISMMALHAQWNLFGHILRLLPNVPANTAMTAYIFLPTWGSRNGRPRTTLPTVFNDNLKGIPYKLKSRKDLQLLRAKSQT